MSTGVPFVDLGWQHAQVAEEVADGFAEVLSTTSFIDGKEVQAFEREYADLLGVDHCVGVGNGTDALEIALRSVGVGPGDEVVLPANTFIATAEAVARCGADVVLADVDAEHLLLDPAAVAAAVTSRTRAIMPVHLYGQAAPVEALQRPGIPIIEDAAQSQGATRFGVAAGALGVAAGTSFYPGKNLGAYGDAGAVLASSSDVARAARLIANHGSERRYHHDVLGFNSRMDTLQAVVLRAKMRRLTEWNEARRRAADRYAELLANLDGVTLPSVLHGNEHVWHLYVIQVEERDRVLAELQSRGIGCAVHYPVPVHLHPAFAHLDLPRGSFPVSETAAGRILSLPMHPGITESQQVRVARALREALA